MVDQEELDEDIFADLYVSSGCLIASASATPALPAFISSDMHS